MSELLHSTSLSTWSHDPKQEACSLPPDSHYTLKCRHLKCITHLEYYLIIYLIYIAAHLTPKKSGWCIIKLRKMNKSVKPQSSLIIKTLTAMKKPKSNKEITDEGMLKEKHQ